jgi:preprotein translocase subunit Sec61beta
MRFTEYPRAESEALIERKRFVIAGVILCWSSYRRPVPAASGAPIGILKSFWIFTKKRAWGYGTIVDWAKLQNLELKIERTAPVITERGAYQLSPALIVTNGVDVRITNRNPVDALGILRFFEEDREGSIPELQRQIIQIHFAVLQHAQKMFNVRPDRPCVITRVEYETEPATGSGRQARIFGRPEWDA